MYFQVGGFPEGMGWSDVSWWNWQYFRSIPYVYCQHNMLKGKTQEQNSDFNIYIYIDMMGATKIMSQRTENYRSTSDPRNWEGMW